MFEHGISYKYEKRWALDWGSETKGNYQPDFSLYLNEGQNPDVVIEHWGIDENDTRKRVTDSWTMTWEQYKDLIEKKRKYWKAHNARRSPVRLIETSIADLRQGATRSERRAAFENRLYQIFRRDGFEPRRLPQTELESRLVKSRRAAFIGFCQNFISRAKKQRISPEKLQELATHFDFESEKERVFVNIAVRIYKKYQSELEKQGKFDFDDLVEKAIHKVSQLNGAITISRKNYEDVDLQKIRYLMIDEYQDFSPLFFHLVKAIRESNPNLKIFCVGDDWQAINGFAGSELVYFTDFQNMFEKASVAYLRNNYRSQANLVHQANRFMAYTGGVDSIPKAKREVEPLHPTMFVERVYIESRKSVPIEQNPDAPFKDDKFDRWGETARLLKACFTVINQYDLSKTTFQILSRNNRIGPFERPDGFRHKLKTCFSKEKFKYFDQNVVCNTVHGSKGSEAEVVILLNVLEGIMPANHMSNRLFRILGLSTEKVSEEEKRLFYVGITRAKQNLYIFTEQNKQSEFITRLLEPHRRDFQPVLIKN